MFHSPLNSFSQLTFLHLFWSMWRARNDFIFNGKPISVNLLTKYFYNLRKDCEVKLTVKKAICSWTPPPQNFVAINVDGSVLGDKVVAGYGCIIRNSNGAFVGAAVGTLGKLEINTVDCGLSYQG